MFDTGKVVLRFYEKLLEFFRQIMILLKNIYIRNEDNQVLTYFNIILACIIITAFISFFHKGAKG